MIWQKHMSVSLWTSQKTATGTHSGSSTQKRREDPERMLALLEFLAD
jgi:hypothetical protein